MEGAGTWLATAFFALMSIAPTSSISMLEVPVAYLIERHQFSRRRATLFAGGVVAGFSALIVLNFGTLFGWVITISTRYSQPALGILICIFAGWLWQRDSLPQELNDADAEQRLFWKIWPLYVKWLCPAIIGVILAQSIL